MQREEQSKGPKAGAAVTGVIEKQQGSQQGRITIRVGRGAGMSSER